MLVPYVCIYYCVSKYRPIKIFLQKYSCFLMSQTSNVVEINLYALNFFFYSVKEAFGRKRNSKATGAGKRMEILIFLFSYQMSMLVACGPFVPQALLQRGFLLLPNLFSLSSFQTKFLSGIAI